MSKHPILVYFAKSVFSICLLLFWQLGLSFLEDDLWWFAGCGSFKTPEKGCLGENNEFIGLFNGYFFYGLFSVVFSFGLACLLLFKLPISLFFFSRRIKSGLVDRENTKSHGFGFLDVATAYLLLTSAIYTLTFWSAGRTGNYEVLSLLNGLFGHNWFAVYVLLFHHLGIPLTLAAFAWKQQSYRLKEIENDA